MQRTSSWLACVRVWTAVAFAAVGVACSASGSAPSGSDTGADGGRASLPSGSTSSGGTTSIALGGKPGVELGGSTSSEAGGAPIGGNCATGSASAARLPVYLMFVLDGSGSMNHDNKWVAVTGAINAIFADMQTKADPGVGAGLIVYSDSTDPNLDTGGSYPSSIDVPLAFVSADQLKALKARTSPPVEPQSNTPTGRALTGGYDELANLMPGAPLLPGGKKVVVLMTDGIPTDQGCKNVKKDGTDDYQANACVKMAKSELVAKAPEGPVETFVIGVGPLPGDFATYDPYFLGELAVAGGSAPPGCNTRSNAAGAKDLCYFNIDPTGASADATQKAFTDVLDAIRGQVVSCTLGITPEGGGTIDPEKVNVLLNDATVAQDETDGWTYDDPNQPTSVTLHGAACETLKGDPAAKISIVLGCVTKKVVK
jgi:hypothetical protein